MKGDAGRSLEVFEFKEEDELPDFVPGKFLGRIKNAAAAGGDDSILKYNYLGFVSNQIFHDNKESGDAEFVDVDSEDTDHGEDGDDTYLITGEVRETDDDDVKDSLSEFEHCKNPVFIQKMIIAEHDSRSFSQDQDATTSGRVDTCNQVLQSNHDMIGCFFRSDERELVILNFPFKESKILNNLKDQIVDAVVSDSEERMANSSPADLLSDFAVNSAYFADHTSDPCSGNQENQNNEITVQPDIVMLNNTYIGDAEMHFTSSGIQLTSLNTCVGSWTRYEWSIDSIIKIEAQYHERVHEVVILIIVLSENSSASDPSGTHEIKVTLYETDWANEQENIMSLSDKYQPLFVWNDGHSWQNQDVSGKLYYPKFDETFEELVFPKNDSDPVTICKRDIGLLEPEIFINDTIIDFYIKYLKDGLEPEKGDKFHFFNSFFFRKLADLERSQFDASEGRTSFLRVRKWTRKVNLFEKDYIFIPVNSNLHWSLILICHPGEIAKFDDNNVKSKRKLPCILHMDSIKGSHTGLKNHIQSYLWEEWKEKQNESTKEISLKFLNLRFISLEVPQQENSYDCGLFLLHYVELFLEEAPECFNPFHITKYSTFLNLNWFPPGDVSLKRAHIQRIIYHMNMNSIHPPQSGPPNTTDEITSPKFPDPNNDNEAVVELLRVKPSLPESCSSDVFYGNFQEKEQSTLEPLYANTQFNEQVSINGLPDAAVQGFNRKSFDFQLKSGISSLQENAGNADHMLSSLPNEAEFKTQSDQVCFQFEDYRMQNMWPATNSTRKGVDSPENSKYSRSSSHDLDDFLNGEVDSDAQMKDDMDLESSYFAESHKNLSETTRFPSPAVAPESASVKTPDCNQDDPVDITTPIPDESQNGATSGEYNLDFDIDASEQMAELRGTKRARIEAHGEAKYTRSNAKDLLS